MYVYHIRSARLEIVILIPNHWHVLRILPALIMQLPEAPIGILVIIGNGNHIGITVRILIRSLPDALQAVPHGSLVRQEHHLCPNPDIVLHAALNLEKHLPQALIYFADSNRLPFLQFPVNPIDLLTVGLQQGNRGKALPFRCFNQVSQRNGSVLAVRQ